jgi:hypothetical protein
MQHRPPEILQLSLQRCAEQNGKSCCKALQGRPFCGTGMKHGQSILFEFKGLSGVARRRPRSCARPGYHPKQIAGVGACGPAEGRRKAEIYDLRYIFASIGASGSFSLSDHLGGPSMPPGSAGWNDRVGQRARLHTPTIGGASRSACLLECCAPLLPSR